MAKNHFNLPKFEAVNRKSHGRCEPSWLKPNSITLSGRRQVRSWSQTCY